MGNLNTKQIPVLVIFGATACGKTAFARNIFSSKANSCLAGQVEIVNADSIQVYKGFEIGSAAPEKELLDVLPHHLIGVNLPDQEFSTADFVHQSDLICHNIFKKNKLPVLLGGSAFFLKNFIFGLPITPQADENIRNKLQQELDEYGVQPLLDRLLDIDPITAKKIHKNDHYRILRALEVYEMTKKPLSSFLISTKPRKLYKFKVIALSRPRDILYNRINERVDTMINSGLQNEFRKLYEKGFRKSTPAMKGIGYAEFFKILPSDPVNAPMDKVGNLIKINTRKYAKRQETFFRAIKDVEIFNLENTQEYDTLKLEIKKFYKDNVDHE